MMVARLAGPMRSLLAMERMALNFLQRLSGIATLTARYVSATAGTRSAIYDTRKTTPGWRALEKYAVRCGGGFNHRFGLYDAVLIKDNHLAWLESAAGPGATDPIIAAIATARANAPSGTTIEVEVDTLEQFDVALRCGPDIILVDNLGPERVAEAVRRRDAVAPGVRLEASGGVTLETVGALAATGVDRISVGALTHSAPALDLALDLEIEPQPASAREGDRIVTGTASIMAELNIPLLDRLRAAAGDYVPMDALGPDTDRVHADLDALTAFGYGIERHPYRGAAYAGPADRLCPDQIEHKLATRWIGRRIAVWSRVGSTNDLAARAGTSASNVGLVVLAEEQTAGRGRRGRSWTAPPRSSILMSVLLFPPPRLASAVPESAFGCAWLTALGAVATAEVVSAWTGREATIKWPNDVRVDGRKIAGILVERASPPGRPAADGYAGEPACGVVIGIGLNVNLDPDAFPPDLRDRATSLRIERDGTTLDRSEVARDLIRRLDHWYDASLSFGCETLNASWCARSEHFGRIVRVATASGPRTGRLVDLDVRNGLTLAIEDAEDQTTQDASAQGLIRLPLAAILALQTWDQGDLGRMKDEG